MLTIGLLAPSGRVDGGSRRRCELAFLFSFLVSHSGLTSVRLQATSPLPKCSRCAVGNTRRTRKISAPGGCFEGQNRHPVCCQGPRSEQTWNPWPHYGNRTRRRCPPIASSARPGRTPRPGLHAIVRSALDNCMRRKDGAGDRESHRPTHSLTLTHLSSCRRQPKAGTPARRPGRPREQAPAAWL